MGRFSGGWVSLSVGCNGMSGCSAGRGVLPLLFAPADKGTVRWWLWEGRRCV